MKNRLLLKALMLPIIVFLLLVQSHTIAAAQEKSAIEIAQKKEIEAAQQATKDAQREAEKAKKEAELQKQSAELLQKKLEVEMIETAAVRQEAEVIRKQAKGGDTIKNSRKNIEKEVSEDKLAEENAKIAGAKLLAIEEKSRIAEEELKLAQSKLSMVELKLKQQKMERGWVEIFLESLAIILIGLVLLVSINLGLKKIEGFLTPKDTFRESEVALRVKTAIKIFNWLGSVAILIFISYMVLENHGFNLAPLLAGAGIVGLAFGFGGQYLIRDLINGLFILLEGQYRINDVVKIGEFGGLVEDLTLRITTLRDLAGRVIVIPNGEIKTVVNYTRDYAQALLDVGVAYKENVDKVMTIIKEVGKEMRSDAHFGKLILNNLEMFGVDDFSDSAVIIKFRIKTLPIRQWEVMREFRRRLKNRFDELGIEIPFPHRTLYWGTGQKNIEPKI